MKKKGSMNRFLENVTLLYVLFIATIVHLGYYILLQENTTLFLFCLVSIVVYLILPNMIVVMGITLLFVDTLYIVNYSYEGFSGSLSIGDLYDVNLESNALSELPKNNDVNDYSEFSGIDISGNNTTRRNTSRTTLDVSGNKPTIDIVDSSSNLWTRADSLADKYPTIAPVNSSDYEYNALSGLNPSPTGIPPTLPPMISSRNMYTLPNGIR